MSIAREKFVLFSILLSLLWPVCAFGDEYVHLIPTDDAYVSSIDPGGVYGGSTDLLVGDRDAAGGDTCISYLMWDLGEIPPGSTITHAEVWLNIHETYPSYQKKTVGAYNVTDYTWDESTINWLSKPLYAAAATSTVTSTFGTGGYYWNVTNDVIAAFDSALGTGTYSVAMVMVPEEFKWNNFYSKEWTPMPDKRPHLEIMYRPPGRVIASGFEPYATERMRMEFGGAGLPPLPSDFFGPGSDPFEGSIEFKPELSDPVTDCDLLIIREAGLLPDPDLVGILPVELVEMKLASETPILVHIDDGSGFAIDSFFDVFVELDVETPSTGEMLVSAQEETFSYPTINLFTRLRFVSQDSGEEIVLKIPGNEYPEPLILSSTLEIPWQDTTTKMSPAGGLDRFYPATDEIIPFMMMYGGSPLAGELELTAPSPDEVRPQFLIDSAEQWQEALGGGSGGSISPMSESDWNEYMDQFNGHLEEGEPYPETQYRVPELYVCEPEGNCEHPEEGLVMEWGDSSEEDGEYAGAWQYAYALDPDLTGCVVKVTVEPPCGINVVSLGMKDVNGNIRAWYWNVAPAAGPPPAGMIECSPAPGVGFTVIKVDLSQTGVAAATPVANSYSSNPAFDITQVTHFSFDENNTFVADVQTPAPGTGIARSWNYWYNLTVVKKVPPADTSGKYYVKWSQRPDVIDDSDPKIIYGWDERSSYQWRPIVADDWLCTDERPVTDIHWWGSFLGWTQPVAPPVMPRAFHIGIWSDVKAGLDPDVPFSHPGVLIWENFCTSYVWNFFGYDKDPRFDWENETCFQFNQLLSEDEWFYQDPNAPWRDDELGGTVYWLSISAIYDTTANVLHPWGWKTRQPHWNDDAVRITDTKWLIDYPPDFPPPTWPPIIGSQWASGDPIEYEGISWDVSFELTTNEPAYEDNPIPGDLNLDGRVTLPDFTIFAGNWLVGVP